MSYEPPDPARPAVVLTGSPVEYRGPLRLEPVAADWDGTLVHPDRLTYGEARARVADSNPPAEDSTRGD